MAHEALVQALPKVELHVHIEGTLEPELKFKLAQRNGIKLPFSSEQEVKDSYTFDDLASFLDAYYDGMNVLLTSEDFYDLAMAYYRKAASQGLRYAEIFFDPQAHTCRGVSFHTVISGLRRAQLEAEQTLGVFSQFIMCFLRDFHPEYAMATLLESLPYKQWIVGVGLDSDETDHEPAKFAAVFARARREGYQLTMHCDVDIKDSIEHIRQVIEDIQVQRVDHGTNVVENPALVKYLVEHRIGLTSCPISNLWISESDKVELVKQLVADGVLVTINSDDPAYFGGYIGDNFQRVADHDGVDEDFLRTLVANAIEISWAPLAVKQRLREELAAV